MKIKIRPDDLSMLQLDDWLAELRKVGWTEPPAAAPALPVRAEAVRAEPAPVLPVRAEAVRAEPAPALPVRAEAVRAAPAFPTRPAVPAEPAFPPASAVPEVPVISAEASPHAGAAHTPVTIRAVIGDQLRMPVMWCELGSCTSSHTDPAALGEGDLRARAIDAGWRIDALGRLSCPRCQRSDPNFRATHQPVPWDRYTALARASRIVAGRSDPALPEYPARPEYPASRIGPAGWRKV